MALDEALINSFKNEDLPILRLYRWKPSISFGRFSDISKSINKEILQQQKFSYVRRITGGGILLHGGDISYSLILPKEFIKNKGVKQSYRYLCKFLINLYKKLGLNASFACDLQIKHKKSDICLLGNEAYDIIIDGKKMGGNAQRHTSQVLFQHGSIPVSFDKALFEPLFLNDSGLNNVSTLEKLNCNIPYEQLFKINKRYIL